MNKGDLIASPHKTLIDRDLFDFIKNRVNIGLCVSKKIVLKPSSQVMYS